MLKIERLLINFKTLEEFKRFKEYGMQELSMLEDLQDNYLTGSKFILSQNSADFMREFVLIGILKDFAKSTSAFPYPLF